MHLRDALAECGPWPVVVEPREIAAAVAVGWGGARIYMTRPAARRAWRRERREPTGAAERLAADVEVAILAAQGTDAQVERVLTMAMGSYLWV